MKILLDTHMLLWFVEGDPRMKQRYIDMILNPAVEKFLSIVSLWEIAIKVNVGKLKLTKPLDELMPEGIDLLDLNLSHAVQYQTLPLYHRDPFDRMLIAQAQVEGFMVMTDDPNFPLYDVQILP